MNNKLIKIKFFDNSCLNPKKYYLKIYNENNELIINNCVQNGIYIFKAQSFKIYRIVAYSGFFECKSFVIYTNENLSKELSIVFENKVKTNHKVTIHLIDQNYEGLPINKGKVILWTDNTLYP